VLLSIAYTFYLQPSSYNARQGNQGDTMKRPLPVVRWGAAFALAVLTAGCTGPVVKGAAKDFVDSGNKLNAATQDLNQQFNANVYALKVIRSTTAESEAGPSGNGTAGEGVSKGGRRITAASRDDSCDPVMPMPGEPPQSTYVRLWNPWDSNDKKWPDRSFIELGQADADTRDGSPTELPACKRLMQCDAHDPTAAVCRTMCYTRPEAQCITLIRTRLEARISKATKPGSLMPDDPDLAILSQMLNAKLDVIEMAPREKSSNLALALSLNAFSAYLSALGALADDNPKAVTPIADHFTSWEKDIVSGYTSASGKAMSKEDQSIQTDVVNTGSAADKLISDVKLAAAAQSDAEKLKILVTQKDNAFSTVISNANSLVYDAIIQNVAISNDVVNRRLAALREQYINARSDDQRYAARQQFEDALAKLPACPDSSAAGSRPSCQAQQSKQLQAKFAQLFKAAQSSHDQLIDAIEHPTDKQKVAMAKETISEFVTIVGDLVKLYKAIP
jgi:hypothetical protein